jgi:predicted RNase H-like HicB family nuclease
VAEIFTRFKNHDITIQRDGDDTNWYIRVRAPNGLYAYDGYWLNSAGKSAKEALQEAKEGALLVRSTSGVGGNDGS